MDFFSKTFGKERLETGLEKETASTASGSGAAVFQVEDVFQIMGVGVIPVGTVLSGELKPGQTTFINGKKAEIKTIEARHTQLAAARAGEKVAINLSGVQKNDLQKGATLEFS